jgi:hypothetical protein
MFAEELSGIVLDGSVTAVERMVDGSQKVFPLRAMRE